MRPDSAVALQIIRECLANGRYTLTEHVLHRMDQRGLFWPDIESVVAAPMSVEYDGPDEHGQATWRVAGRSGDRLSLEVVFALDRDLSGDWTVIVTVYWKNS